MTQAGGSSPTRRLAFTVERGGFCDARDDVVQAIECKVPEFRFIANLFSDLFGEEFNPTNERTKGKGVRVTATPVELRGNQLEIEGARLVLQIAL